MGDSKKTLTNIELNIIYDQISDKLVNRICNQIINNTKISTGLSKQISKTMIDILGKPFTSNKLENIILQNVNVLMRKSFQGPYLLYSLLTKETDKVTNVLNKYIDEMNYTDDSVYKFTKSLIDKLSGSTIIDINKKGGKKTLRKKNKWSTRRNRTRNMRGGTDPNNKNIYGINSLVNTIGNSVEKLETVVSNNIPLSNTEEPQLNSQQQQPPQLNSQSQQQPPQLNSQQQQQQLNSQPQQQQLQTNNDILINKYTEALINRSTQNLLETSNQISKKMVNASYKYMMRNGKTILNSTSGAVTNIFKDVTPDDLTNIIITQALFNSKDILSSAIKLVVIEKREESKKNNKNYKFNPSNIVTDILNKLKTELEKKLSKM